MPNKYINRFMFYFFSSFIIATAMYYVLWFIMPSHYVFGALFRMFTYHWEKPVPYIIIPCFFYGITATAMSKAFERKKFTDQMYIMILIVFLTILLSSPFGGMLWHFHDMQAGFFPSNWFKKMITYGTFEGLKFGWMIILLSIPYNICGIIVSYILTKKGVEVFV